MTFGHFESGRWVTDGNLSDCNMHLTESEFDALTALTLMGFAALTSDNETFYKSVEFVIAGIDAAFPHFPEFIKAKDGLATKIHIQYTVYMDEIKNKESRTKIIHDHVRWTFKGGN